MKKLLIIALLALLAAPVAAQEITLNIINPKDGAEAFAGRLMPIDVGVEVSGTEDTPKLMVDVDVARTGAASCIQTSKADFTYNYRCMVRIPTDNNTIDIIVKSTAIWAIGKTDLTRTASKTLTLNVTNRLYPELVYPLPNAPTTLTDKKHVKARLWYPGRDKQYDLKSAVEADVNGEKVNFVWNESEALFVAEYDLGGFERGVPLEMKITLLGDVSGSETFYPILAAEGVFAKREEFPLAAVLGGVGAAGAVVVIAVWFFAFRRKRAETKGELEVKRKHLRELIKMTTVDFYKRRLSEEEFKKRSMEYQMQLDEIEAKLGVQKTGQKQQPKAPETETE